MHIGYIVTITTCTVITVTAVIIVIDSTNYMVLKWGCIFAPKTKKLALLYVDSLSKANF